MTLEQNLAQYMKNYDTFQKVKQKWSALMGNDPAFMDVWYKMVNLINVMNRIKAEIIPEMGEVAMETDDGRVILVCSTFPPEIIVRRLQRAGI